MADAAARREARRRRILENSHNRLQLISGKTDNETPTVSPAVSPVPIEICDVHFKDDNSCLPNGDSFTNSNLLEFLNPPDNIASGDNQLSNDFAAHLSSYATETTRSRTPTIWDEIVIYKYDVVLVSLLIQTLYALITPDYETYFFLPIVIYIVIKLQFFPAQNRSKFWNLLVMIAPPNRVKGISLVAQLISTLSEDICIYLFSTICFQSLLSMLQNSST